MLGTNISKKILTKNKKCDIIFIEKVKKYLRKDFIMEKSQHSLLRERIEQHKIKNIESKKDDEQAKNIADELVFILEELYPSHSFERKSQLTYKQIFSVQKELKSVERKINPLFEDRKIIPDGGVIWMDKKYPILITEMKRQGTNKERLKEGKTRQAVGNAIERLGKNVLACKTMFENVPIFPFICFCRGCDFLEATVLSKLYALNSFYDINIFYGDLSSYVEKPFNIYTNTTEEQWDNDFLAEKMLETAINAIEYFIKR